MEPLDPEYNGYAYDDSSSEDESVPQKNCKELTFEEEEEVESSEDEFEKDMKHELDGAMSNYEQLYGCGTNKKSVVPANQCLDSDDDDELLSGSQGTQHDDELLYDPHSDELDKQWIDQERFKCLPRGTNSNKSAILPQSDAVLNCPGCMTLLCLDCQKHAVYSNQYRAMFVRNCRVLYSEVKNCPMKGIQKKLRKRKLESVEDEARVHGDDDFHPVHCSVCDTEVAAFDKDEVYHFFNILASN